MRQAESRKRASELRAWFETQLARLPARNPTAVPIRYALNHWDGLEWFVDDDAFMRLSDKDDGQKRRVVGQGM